MGDGVRHTLVERDVPSISCIASSSRHLCFSLSLLLSFESSGFIRGMEVASLKPKLDGSIMDGKDYKIVKCPQSYDPH